MDLGLKGRRALVTGSTAGIGFSIARTLAREGAHVVINGRTQARVDQAIERIKADVPEAQLSGVPADLSTAAGVDQLIARMGTLDILVNNAAVFEPKAFGDITDADWTRFFETNVMSGVRLARHHLPHMLARNSGRILFISSESAVQIPSEMIHYGMTKTAQLAVSRGLAALTKGTRVTVNAVMPGTTRSEGIVDFLKSVADDPDAPAGEIERAFFAKDRATSLIQRMIEPEEIAALVAYVASPLSSATNGAALRVDGGITPTIV